MHRVTIEAILSHDTGICSWLWVDGFAEEYNTERYATGVQPSNIMMEVSWFRILVLRLEVVQVSDKVYPVTDANQGITRVSI